MRLFTFILVLQLAVGSWQISIAQNSRANKSEEAQLWKSLKRESGFKKIFKKYKKYRFEIIFTQIDRGLNGEIKLKNFHLGDSSSYFYPASKVKYPLAIAVAEMLQKAPFHNVNRKLFLKLDSVSYCSHRYENSVYQAIGWDNTLKLPFRLGYHWFGDKRQNHQSMTRKLVE
jgi:hypothetical protein